MPASIRRLMPIGIIFLLGLIIYSNSIAVPFVLDDVTSILVNPQVKSFVFSFKTRIIGELTFALNYALHGLSLPGYHLVNLTIHLANASLVFLLVTVIFRTPLFENFDMKNNGVYVATAAALIFVAHPLQTGAVTYIAQRVTILAAFFFLISILFYLKSRLAVDLRVSALWIVLSMLSAAAAVFSKESAVTVPVAVMLCEFTFFKGGGLRRLHWLLYLLPPFALILLYSPALLFQPDIPMTLLSMTAEKGAPSRVEYLFSQFPVIVKYLKLYVFPVGQNLDHDMPIRNLFFDPAVFFSFTALASFVGSALLVLIKGKKQIGLRRILGALTAFGILWFFVTISLESGLVPIRDLMFEHRMYIPSIGLSISVSTILFLFFSGPKIEILTYRKFSIVIAVIAVVLGMMTYARNRAWQSEVSIWEDAVSKSPQKGRTHGALGHAYQRAKMWSEAKREYVEALKLSPTDHIAANNLGVIYLIEKKYPEAIIQFKKAIELLPTTSAVHYNMGLAYASIGNYPDAKNALQEAIRLKPDSMAAKNTLERIEKLMVQ